MKVPPSNCFVAAAASSRDGITSSVEMLGTVVADRLAGHGVEIGRQVSI